MTTSNHEASSPIEVPRISAEISVDIDDLRQRALRGEQISVEEYYKGILKIRELFGRRIEAKATAKPARAAKSATKKTKTPVNADDLLGGLLG